jgi:hypothetical protein
MQLSQLMQEDRYFWDITICCIGSHNSWRRRKVKSEKRESQLVRQAKHSSQNEAVHRKTAQRTTGTNLRWTTSSTLIEGIYHEILIHLSCQSMNNGILYQRHQKVTRSGTSLLVHHRHQETHEKICIERHCKD